MGPGYNCTSGAPLKLIVLLTNLVTRTNSAKNHIFAFVAADAIRRRQQFCWWALRTLHVSEIQSTNTLFPHISTCATCACTFARFLLIPTLSNSFDNRNSQFISHSISFIFLFRLYHLLVLFL